MSPLAIFSIVVLLVFAGFLAASESALTSISRVVIDELEGKRGERCCVSTAHSLPAI